MPNAGTAPYVHNCPLNFVDPNGLFASSIYDYTCDAISSVWNSPKFQGGCQMVGGFAEMNLGGAIAYGTCWMAGPLGFGIMLHGADHLTAGYRTFTSGDHSDTLTSHMLQKADMSDQSANFLDNFITIVCTLGASTVLRAEAVILLQLKLSSVTNTSLQNLKNNSSAICEECYNVRQSSLLTEHLRQAEKYGKGGYKKLPNGNMRYYGTVTPANNTGEMVGRRVVREWNHITDSKRSWHETLDHFGKIRIVRPEMNNGIKVHYLFDETGNYVGTR